MTITRGLAAGAALALLAAACGARTSLPMNSSGSGGAGGGPSGCAGGGSSGNPLVGSWVTSMSVGEWVADTTLTFDADGTAVLTETCTGCGSASCSGSLEYTGITWSAAGSTLTISESAQTCTGGVMCSNGSIISCAPATGPPHTCTYTLSNANDTLELDCPTNGGNITFTRQC